MPIQKYISYESQRPLRTIILEFCKNTQFFDEKFINGLMQEKGNRLIFNILNFVFWYKSSFEE